MPKISATDSLRTAIATAADSISSSNPDNITMIQKVTLEELIGNLEDEIAKPNISKKSNRQAANSRSGYLTYKVRQMRQVGN